MTKRLPKKSTAKVGNPRRRRAKAEKTQANVGAHLNSKSEPPHTMEHRYISKHREAHPSFRQPRDGSSKIWRYLNLEKLIALLTSGHLVFNRVDLFDDEYEGSVTRGVYMRAAKNPHLTEQLTLLRSQIRKEWYASCWHLNNSESEAMWRLYSPRDSGVALQTTYERLDRSLPPSIYLGEVEYVDYDDVSDATETSIPNAFEAMMQKRSAFAHEREVRALGRPELRMLKEGEVPSERKRVFSVPWDAHQAIEHVYVSPYAPQWYRDVIETVLKKFAPTLVERLEWSQMKGVPLF
jgi:hypothetical protein